MSDDAADSSPRVAADNPPHTAAWLDLGREEYARTYELQTRLHDRRKLDEVPDTVVVVEHLPCVTIGRAGRRESIVASDGELLEAGVAVHQSDRGGDVTYHGPGQVVLYPIVDLKAYGRDVHAHARRLEQVLIDAIGSYGIEATRRKEYPGVWTAQGKVAAIGLRVSRWVTLHGVALNVSPDMSHFSLIVPCGIQGENVTSLAQLLGRPVETAEVKARLRGAFERVFAVRLHDVSKEDLCL